MQEDAAYKVCSGRRISSAAATILLIAISTAAQPGKSDLSNVTVLRDIE